MNSRSKHFPWRTFYQVAFIHAALVICAIVASGLAARYYFKKYFIQQVQSQLQDMVQVLSRDLDLRSGPALCIGFESGSSTRLTISNEDGKVICDSWEKPNLMNEYFSRPEIINSLKNLKNKEEKFFSSIDGEMVYETLAVPAYHLVIRGGISLSSLSIVIRVFNTSLGLFLAVLMSSLLVVALWLAKKLVFPLGRLIVKTQGLIHHQSKVLTKEDLEEESFGEWSELESSIDDLGKNLEKTVQSLSMEQGELDTIMGSISDAILAVDQEEVPIFYNSRFEVIFGSGGVRRNIKLWEILRDPEVLKAYKTALKEGRASDTKVFLLEAPHQPKRYFSLSVSPLIRLGNSIYGALGIFHDVTELKAAEQMRIDFVANVSHELRTPLTAIKGYTETMIEDLNLGKLDESSKDFLAIIQRNSNRLMNLMQDLLDLSAIESTVVIQKESLSTQEITERVLKQLASRFENKKQKVDLFFEAPIVAADSNRLEQILINLLDNANKYTPEGESICLKWEGDRKGGRDVFLKVQDSGPGISVDHQSRLFERFYRVDKARSREQGGTGLGLAIVKHIMQRHEGVIWVESEVNKGSTFVCRFPG